MSEFEALCVSNESIEELIDAWRTEVHAPEILPFKADLVYEIDELLQNQQLLLDRQIDRAEEAEVFAISMYQMDIERVKYSLCRYLRTRLLKIQQGIDFISNKMDMLDRLSPAERRFCDQLQALNNDHIQEIVSQRLGEAADYFDASKDRLLHTEPKLNVFVFCRAAEDIADIPISDKFLSVRKGDINILQYSCIRSFVLQQKMHLL